MTGFSSWLPLTAPSQLGAVEEEKEEEEKEEASPLRDLGLSALFGFWRYSLLGAYSSLSIFLHTFNSFHLFLPHFFPFLRMSGRGVDNERTPVSMCSTRLRRGLDRPNRRNVYKKD